ncbi:MAG: CsgG/HfaB family protein [Anaeromyxobacter sp.]
MSRSALASCVRALLACLLALAAAGAWAAQPVTLPRDWDDRYFDLAADGASTRQTLAVLPFSFGEGMEQVGQLHAADILASALFKSGRFELVERAKLDQILAEQQLGQSGKVDVSTAARIGKLVGAQLVVFGSVAAASQEKVDKFAYDLVVTEVRVESRAIETSTGRFVFTENASGRAEAKVVTDAHGTVISGLRNPEAEYVKAATAAVLTLSEKLSRSALVVGYVVSVDGDRLVTDIGSERDLRVKQRLVIVRPTRRLIHPVTKKQLGWEKVVLGEAEVDGVEAALSKARVLRLTADQPVQPGDIVVLQGGEG